MGKMGKGIFCLGILYLAILFMFTGCGPVVWTAGVEHPPPVWFYPNRLEIVRYVYFPEFRIYYDLSTRAYLYLEGSTWVRTRVLPPRYRSLDFRRLRYQRVRGYRGDSIQRYHEENNANRGRSNRTARGRRSG